MKASLPRRVRFFLALAGFFYRRAIKASPTVPDGVPGIRDAENPCAGYEPRKPLRGDWDCFGDGHYLCQGCAHLVPEDGSS